MQGVRLHPRTMPLCGGLSCGCPRALGHIALEHIQWVGSTLLPLCELRAVLLVLRPVVLRVEARWPRVLVDALGILLPRSQWWSSEHTLEHGVHQDLRRRRVLRRRHFEVGGSGLLWESVGGVDDAGLLDRWHVVTATSVVVREGSAEVFSDSLVGMHGAGVVRSCLRADLLAALPLRRSLWQRLCRAHRLELSLGGGLAAGPRLQALLVPYLLGLSSGDPGDPLRTQPGTRGVVERGHGPGLRRGALPVDLERGISRLPGRGLPGDVRRNRQGELADDVLPHVRSAPEHVRERAARRHDDGRRPAPGRAHRYRLQLLAVPSGDALNGGVASTIASAGLVLHELQAHAPVAGQVPRHGAPPAGVYLGGEFRGLRRIEVQDREARGHARGCRRR
mmetsp:Transcript_108150/g.312527  ORF Transcript_108150/g.312527 Transcript_108150/m.312527 type:complete len:393 (-) Transcript_108150:336-1514(-)